MTFLIDPEGTPEEAGLLRAVGIDVLERRGKINLILPDSTVSLQVAVDASLVEIMSPPICFNCFGGPLEVIEGTSTVGGEKDAKSIRLTCPSCGAWELRSRGVSPKEDNDED